MFCTLLSKLNPCVFSIGLLLFFLHLSVTNSSACIEEHKNNMYGELANSMQKDFGWESDPGPLPEVLNVKYAGKPGGR